jgi:hypothetical protein
MFFGGSFPARALFPSLAAAKRTLTTRTENVAFTSESLTEHQRMNCHGPFNSEVSGRQAPRGNATKKRVKNSQNIPHPTNYKKTSRTAVAPIIFVRGPFPVGFLSPSRAAAACAPIT